MKKKNAAGDGGIFTIVSNSIVYTGISLQRTKKLLINNLLEKNKSCRPAFLPIAHSTLAAALITIQNSSPHSRGLGKML